MQQRCKKQIKQFFHVFFLVAFLGKKSYMAKGGRSRSFGGFVAGMPRSSVAHLRIVGKELQHLADIVQRHLRQVGFRGRGGAGMFDGIGMDFDRYIYI